MWICSICQQKFVYENAHHSCNERSVEKFLEGKSEITKELFWYFINTYLEMGDFVLHPAKSRIAFAADIRFGYIHRLGKEYVDIVFQFREHFQDNFCFYKIANVPDSNIYNHYLRLERKEDINSEVRKYMSLALDIGKRKHLSK